MSLRRGLFFLVLFPFMIMGEEDPWLIRSIRIGDTVRYSYVRTSVAEKSLRDNILSNPKIAKTHFQLGVFLYSNFPFTRMPEAEKELDTAIQLDSNYYDAYIVLGRAWEDMGYISGAELMYREAIKRQPQNIIGYENLSYFLSSEGDLKGALEIAQEAFEYDSNFNDPFLLVSLSSFLYDLGRKVEAEFYARRAVSILPNQFEFHVNLASVLLALKKYGEAEKEFREAIKLAPNRDFLYNQLGLTLKRDGQYKEAEEMYRKAIELNPLNYQATNNLGILLFETKGSAGNEAESLFRATIINNPDYSLSYTALASLLFEKGDTDQAKILFGKAIAVDSNNITSFAGLMGILYFEDSLDEAENIGWEALRIDPENLIIHNILGLLIGKKGNIDSAYLHLRKAFERVNELDKDYQELAVGNYVWVLLDKSLQCCRLGDLNQAQKNIDEVFEILQKFKIHDTTTEKTIFGQAYYLRGITNLLGRKNKKGVSDLEVALTFSPKSMLIRYNLAYGYYSTGDWDKAELAAIAATSIDSTNAKARDILNFIKENRGSHFYLRGWQIIIIILASVLFTVMFIRSRRTNRDLHTKLKYTLALGLILIVAAVFFLPFVKGVTLPGGANIDLDRIQLPASIELPLSGIQLPEDMFESSIEIGIRFRPTDTTFVSSK